MATLLLFRALYSLPLLHVDRVCLCVDHIRIELFLLCPRRMHVRRCVDTAGETHDAIVHRSGVVYVVDDHECDVRDYYGCGNDRPSEKKGE